MLVLLVVFVFLQTWRATLIPMLAVPVSLIGTFAGLWLFGFSINTLTLFAMVLAIGIVVDDAIVVLENVERLMREEKMAPMAAAIEAMREVPSAVIAHRARALRGVHPGRLPRRHRGPAVPAVRGDGGDRGGDLGLHRADADAGAVRAAAQAGDDELTTASVLHAVQSRLRAPSRGASCAAWTWRCTHRAAGARDLRRRDRSSPGCCSGTCRAASCRPRTRATSSAAAACPTARRWSAPPQITAAVAQMMREQPGGRVRLRRQRHRPHRRRQQDATRRRMFIPLKPWDERKQTRAGPRAGRERAGLARSATAWRSPSIRRRSAASARPAASRSTCSRAARLAIRSASAQVLQRLHERAARAVRDWPASTRSTAPTVPQLRVEVDREKALALGVPVERRVRRAAGHDGRALRQRLQHVGRTFRVQMQAERRSARSPTTSAASTCARSTTQRR